MSSLRSEILDLPSTSPKFSRDITWNVVSLGIMGICGVLLNMIIAKCYGSGVLGVFSQVYVIYIFLSQLAVGGINFSILKNISLFSGDISKCNVIMNAALLLTMTISLIVVLMLFFIRGFFSFILNSESVGIGIFYVLPGLFFFALNKILLAYNNGCRRMKAIAFFQSLRYTFLLSTLIVFTAMSLSGKKITVIFSISEFLLFPLLLGYSLRFFEIEISRSVYFWIKKHIVFGFKAMFGNMLSEANTRIDVLMLGIFVSDATVGIYSLAAMLIEGFNQFATVFMINVNPILTRYKYAKDDEPLGRLVRKGRNMFYALSVPLGITAILVFPVLLRIFGIGLDFSKSWGVFAILMVGSLIGSGYLPFNMILNQSGFPFHQTILKSLVFATNVTLNLLLIPIVGMYGAAIATCIAFILQIYYLKKLTYRVIGIRI